VKQDKIDAQSTVDGRLTFIEGQIKETEKSIDGIKGESEKRKMEVSNTILALDIGINTFRYISYSLSYSNRALHLLN
jgi:hypothetical protein